MQLSTSVVVIVIPIAALTSLLLLAFVIYRYRTRQDRRPWARQCCSGLSCFRRKRPQSGGFIVRQMEEALPRSICYSNLPVRTPPRAMRLSDPPQVDASILGTREVMQMPSEPKATAPEAGLKSQRNSFLNTIPSPRWSMLRATTNDDQSSKRNSKRASRDSFWQRGPREALVPGKGVMPKGVSRPRRRLSKRSSTAPSLRHRLGSSSSQRRNALTPGVPNASPNAEPRNTTSMYFGITGLPASFQAAGNGRSHQHAGNGIRLCVVSNPASPSAVAASQDRRAISTPTREYNAFIQARQEAVRRIRERDCSTFAGKARKASARMDRVISSAADVMSQSGYNRTPPLPERLRPPLGSQLAPAPSLKSKDVPERTSSKKAAAKTPDPRIAAGVEALATRYLPSQTASSPAPNLEGSLRSTTPTTSPDAATGTILPAVAYTPEPAPKLSNSQDTQSPRVPARSSSATKAALLLNLGTAPQPRPYSTAIGSGERSRARTSASGNPSATTEADRCSCSWTNHDTPSDVTSTTASSTGGVHSPDTHSTGTPSTDMSSVGTMITNTLSTDHPAHSQDTRLASTGPVTPPPRAPSRLSMRNIRRKAKSPALPHSPSKSSPLKKATSRDEGFQTSPLQDSPTGSGGAKSEANDASKGSPGKITSPVKSTSAKSSPLREGLFKPTGGNVSAGSPAGSSAAQSSPASSPAYATPATHAASPSRSQAPSPSSPAPFLSSPAAHPNSPAVSPSPNPRRLSPSSNNRRLSPSPNNPRLSSPLAYISSPARSARSAPFSPGTPTSRASTPLVELGSDIDPETPSRPLTAFRIPVTKDGRPDVEAGRAVLLPERRDLWGGAEAGEESGERRAEGDDSVERGESKKTPRDLLDDSFVAETLSGDGGVRGVVNSRMVNSSVVGMTESPGYRSVRGDVSGFGEEEEVGEWGAVRRANESAGAGGWYDQSRYSQATQVSEATQYSEEERREEGIQEVDWEMVGGGSEHGAFV